MGQWNPKRLSPKQLEVVRLHWQGWSAVEISGHTEYTVEHISNILNSQVGQEYLEDMIKGSLDCTSYVETFAQAVSPMVMHEKFRLSLEAKDERVRSSSCSDILNIAGHQPVKRVQIDRVDPVVGKYDGMTEEEIRAAVLEGVGSPTVH